jgi:hypothetical protein
MAADMGRNTVNGQDADGFAQLLAGAAAEINYAAADIYGGPEIYGGACTTFDNGNGFDDKYCTGFYENFEANIPLIEARIVKVMLAALPVDKARKFLDSLSKGNVLDAAWKAMSAAGAIIRGMHVGFARYRTGLEVVAANVATCQKNWDVELRDKNEASESKYAPERMTVVLAAKCLGLTEDDLFNNPKELERAAIAKNNTKNNLVRPRAFLMLMRSIAADCVSLNFSGKGEDLTRSQETRAKACNSIGFIPTPRPFRFKKGTEGLYDERPVEVGTVPADEKGVPLPTPWLTEPFRPYPGPFPLSLLCRLVPRCMIPE